MKIVSHNIERGYKPEEIGNFLLDMNADVYNLTEVDRGNKRTKEVDVVRVLSQKFPTFDSKFAEEFQEKNHRIRDIIYTGGPGGGVTGNQVLSRYKLHDYEEIKLVDPSKLRNNKKKLLTPNWFEPRYGSRVAQFYSVKSGDRDISFCNTHLENWEFIEGFAARKLQLQQILDISEPDIFTGDMNNLGMIGATIFGKKVNNETKKLRKFMREYEYYDPFEDTDYTFERLGMRSKLDRIFIKDEIKILRHEVIKTNLSDHHALMVEVDV